VKRSTPSSWGNWSAAGLAIALSIATTALWSECALSHTLGSEQGSNGAVRQPAAAKEALHIETVDHVMLEPVPPGKEAMELEDAGNDSAPLHLHLAPRIVNRLRGIFGDAEQSPGQESKPELPVSPVAEMDEGYDAEPSADDTLPESSIEETLESPLLERRMYRIDI